MMLIKSRNTMVASAILFLVVVILLRFAGGLFEDNIGRVVGSIFGGSAENIPVIDFASIDISWLNPSNWSMDGITEGVNAWLHKTIDSVLPAFINMINFSVITAVIARTKLLSAMVSAVKVAPVIV